MLTDPEFGPWREEALKRGYASSVVFPFNHDGKTFGALTIYSKMPDPFSVAELELLGELTNRLVYGIVMLRLRAEKEKLDEARLQDQIEITNLHKNLQHKMKKVEKSNQELEAFNSSVSHDLSAPLHAITAFSQIIFDDHDQNLSLVSQDALGRVINNAKTMGHVIEGLLEISDIKNIEIVRNRVNISMLVDEIATELQGSTPDREVDFIIAKNIMADCDPNILSIIMNNLMRNSYKFTSKKAEAIIEFGIEKEIYFLRDNGAGFDMRHKDKLFGAFERLHTVHEFPGTGIGLATVLRGIRRHQGLIWAEAEVDKGATFFFTLGK
jgi:light-regulated signal transduction histidine kinase (bacteriophytochrome)